MKNKTKYIICLGDGMADWPIASLNNQTPLSYAHIPNMDFIAQNGISGLVHTVPENLNPGSDVANMGILGYDPRLYYTGRGAIEAAAMNITAPKGSLIFRLNLVNIENNVMKDFTSGHISNNEASQLLDELNHHFKNKPITFHAGVGYRNIVILNDTFKHLSCTAPHDITDKVIDNYLPKGPTEKDMLTFILECRTILAQSNINKIRIQNGQKPATDIWPWSQGVTPKLPSFKETFHKTGGIITAVDLLKGLAKLAKLDAPNVKGATGFTDTNYAEKITESFAILDTHDFVYIHIEAPDECGHMGDEILKTSAIEDFDKHIIAPVLAYQKRNPNTVIAVLPDHPTPCEIKTHSNEAVPFAIYCPGIQSNGAKGYSEIEAKKTHLVIKYPWELLQYFLQKIPVLA